MRASEHPSYCAIRAAFPGVKLDGGGMTTQQGRVCFMQERLLYGQPGAHACYVYVCGVLGIPDSIEGMSAYDCARALAVLEAVAMCYPVMGRSTATGWQSLLKRHEIPYGASGWYYSRSSLGVIRDMAQAWKERRVHG